MAQHINSDDYLALMASQNLFSDNAAEPEHNLSVWSHFHSLCRSHADLSNDHEIIVLCDRYGFFKDPLDNERSGMNWALATPILDPILPITQAQFKSDLPALTVELENENIGPVITDSFAFADGYITSSSTGLVGLNSPVAETKDSFETYLESLSSTRRQKYRRMAPTYDDPRFRFELSSNTLTTTEIDFARTNLTQRWGSDDMKYALAQTLWTQAAGTVMPSRALYMRVYDRDRLIFVQTMLCRLGGVYAQSIFKDESVLHDGIAPFTDFKTIKALCSTTHGFLDPSCRTSLEDPESIGIAKRATVNKDVVKPIAVLGPSIPDAITSLVVANTITGKPV